MKNKARKITAFVLIAVMILTTVMYQTVSAAAKPAKVKGITAKANSKKKTIKLSWKKVKGATGYVIYKNTKKNFKKVKATNVKKTKKTFKKLKLGKTYYFKIAAYKKTKKGKLTGKAVIKKVKLKKLTAQTPTETPTPSINYDALLGMSKKTVGDTMISPITDKTFTLKFIDEFEGTTINTDNWSYFERNYNSAEESVNRKENVIVSDGLLNIYGKKEDKTYTGDAESWETPKVSNLTGGAINSQGKKEFKYGRLEIYCKIPYSRGMWPAFWTMGTQRGWPWGGEIDIMEFVGGTDEWGNYRDDEYHCGLHWADPNTSSDDAWGGAGHLTANFGRNYEILGGPDKGAKLHDKWRVCGLEWNETTMYTYCDGDLIGSIDITKSTMREAFHQTHYMILNLVMGGSWAGHPSEANGTVFPQVFQVDWVKVWQ